MGVTKICFKCGTEQELGEFYKHPAMGDGHLNKCKTCTKKDSAKREKIIRSTPEGIESERKRAREKYHRLGYRDIQKEQQKIRYRAGYKDRIRELDEAKPWRLTSVYKGLSRKMKHRFPQFRSKHMHHWNYNLLFSVFILDMPFHNEIHRRITFDEKNLCYSYSGEPLDTKEKHKQFLLDMKKELNYKNEIIYIELN